ncbi:low molecular weight phosphotyrosine protein phosphatase [Pseudoxanthomonas sp. CAU 1598]|uniref:protein-tyrosine-phosphatase n=1 Tax=Pseudomarimonas arenosa TaxID=2774145 RepID=A0AAW3ZJE2_9GAMM|nr:low molecular weight phosphotyrosine protein phosphatase [Pseudomarimonas arenosa]
MPRRVLLVCTGNICRSPLAEGILRHHSQAAGLNIEFDSAGTHSYHVGEPPDARAIQAARARGVNIEQLRARRIEAEDFARFDCILVADHANLQALQARLGPVSQTAQLLLAKAGIDPRGEVPDPYYASLREFEACFDLLDRAARKLLSSWLNPA